MQYLKFPDEAAARALTGWWSENNGWLTPTKKLQFAVRGTLYNSDGVYDDETGECLNPPTAREGYHIDVIYGDIPAEAQGYVVTPSNPDFVLA